MKIKIVTESKKNKTGYFISDLQFLKKLVKNTHIEMLNTYSIFLYAIYAKFLFA